MTMQTLEGRSEQIARSALAEALLRQLPQQLVPQHNAKADVEETVLALIAEARAQLSIDPVDDSMTAKSRIADLIASELTARETPKSIAEVADRVGQLGQLLPDDYQIQPIQRRRDDPDLRVTNDHIRSVLRHPDAVQHLSPPASRRTGGGLSLYAKWIGNRTGRAPYIMLVPCERKGLHLQPLAGLRVYPSEVDLHDAFLPLEILKRFLEVYGLQFTIGGDQHPRKFAMYAQVTLGVDGVEGNLISPHPSNPNVAQWMCVLLKRNPEGSVDLAIVFLLNVTMYRETLRRHRS